MKYQAVAAVAIACAIPSVAHAKQRHEVNDLVQIDNASRPTVSYQLMRTSRDAVNVYINPHGGAISGGWENSARASSGLVASRGSRGVHVPRFRGGSATLRRLIGCVRDRYEPFNVNILTQRPRNGHYIMVMLGGSSRMLGYPASISGVAPFNGRVIDNAIVFVFDRSRRRHNAMCNTVVHEVGHALGLEHEYLCSDPMSYLHACRTKRFRDVDAWCGEFRARRCKTGGRQNTYRLLAQAVGLRTTTQQPDPDPPDPDSDSDSDTRAPDVTIVSERARGTARDGSVQYEIRVRARDAGGVASVQLGWATPDQRYVFECGRIDRRMPVTCDKSGNTYVFRLWVGYGKRAYAVKVLDRAGNSTVTGAQNLDFGDEDDGDEAQND